MKLLSNGFAQVSNLLVTLSCCLYVTQYPTFETLFVRIHTLKKAVSMDVISS